jgi:uncharacterized protein (UPF0333 family)
MDYLMVKQSSKGQVSLEYLMTYGIAIAIVVIAVAALYSMNVFTPKTSTTPPCTNCFGDFMSTNSFSYNTTSTKFALELKNGVGGLTINSCTNCTYSPGATISPNQVFIVYVDKNVSGTTTVDTTAVITYTKDGSTLPVTRTQTIPAAYFK